MLLIVLLALGLMSLSLLCVLDIPAHLVLDRVLLNSTIKTDRSRVSR